MLHPCKQFRHLATLLVALLGIVARAEVAPKLDIETLLSIQGNVQKLLPQVFSLRPTDIRRLMWELEEQGVDMMVAPGLIDITNQRLRARQFNVGDGGL